VCTFSIVFKSYLYVKSAKEQSGSLHITKTYLCIGQKLRFMLLTPGCSYLKSVIGWSRQWRLFFFILFFWPVLLVVLFVSCSVSCQCHMLL